MSRPSISGGVKPMVFRNAARDLPQWRWMPTQRSVSGKHLQNQRELREVQGVA
ncbi:hypothetical protein BD311DRAFT_723782 [Dichomitus squalens]|uniref:Uncharacterized protein n=1 Tax=Dichomitus squalens TaxID=114155 RepID=A0A4Q9MNR4_9APHY|nr:hypothetical protein BD311DRAFT_723782 [Dichomitus squalens]